MGKILSQSGISLADMYDVQGSIAGIDELVSNDVSLVHEMGSTVFSERVSTAIRKVSVTGVLQSASFAPFIADLPASARKILGIQVSVSMAGRLANAVVSVRDPVGLREFPIWAWDATNTSTLRVDDAGVTDTIFLNRDLQFQYVPLLMLSSEFPLNIPHLVLRGTTTAFGGGTLDLSLLAHIAFTVQAGVSSFGLPIPSW